MSKPKKLNLTAFLKAITETKEDLTQDPRFNKEYNPFIINRFLSMNSETALVGLYLSQHSHFPKHVHFNLLREMLEKKRVYFKFYKSEGLTEMPNFDKVQQYFETNKDRTEEIYNLLSEEQVKKIVNSFGGK